MKPEVRDLVLKVASRCNLACDYCYMYEMADQSWRDQPRFMSTDVIDAVARQIRAAGVSPQVIFHGGEPLLVKPDRLEQMTATLRDAGVNTFSILTNATLVTPEAVRVLKDNQVRVGVSLDGGPEQHDKHRTFPGRQGSWQQAAAGLRQLQEENLLGGMLCVADITSDPLETWHALASWQPRRVDFLLPLRNRTFPGYEGTPYADWLLTIFRDWYAAESQPVRIRFFEMIMRMLLGGKVRSGFLGNYSPGTLTVETDGSLEMVDALKSVYQGAAATGYNILRDPLADVLAYQERYERDMGITSLCGTCRQCPVVATCGGGYFVQRWNGASFFNPSYYCDDYYRLITGIAGTVGRDTGGLA